MNYLKTMIAMGAIMFTTMAEAQQLSANDKTVKVEEFPEYVIINCDNSGALLVRTIRIVIQSKNSDFEKALTELQDLLEGRKYLRINNQTDLLNAMAKLGFDYVNAFPQNSNEGASTSRTGFVFRKKEKYRN